MLKKEQLLKIIGESIFDSNILSENNLYIDNVNELLIINSSLYLRLSYDDKVFSFDEIILSNNLRGNKRCFKLIGNLIDYSKELETIDTFKVSSIVSNKMMKICEFYNMEHSDDAIYGEISEDYDFDGYLGSMIISTK